MPFFGKNFKKPKFPVRKKLDFHPEPTKKVDIDSVPIKINLGSEVMEFSNGAWKPVTGSEKELRKEMNRLKVKSTELKEENNLLKVKIEILLDMLTIKAMQSSHEEIRVVEVEEVTNKKL